MKSLFCLIQKAKHAKKYLWLLNHVLNFFVRFNKPHHFKVISLTDACAQTLAPYCKKNFNHVRGIHACAIATVGELAAGMILMANFSPVTYRVIMSRITIDYHYQAKKNIIATALLSPEDKINMVQALSAAPSLSHTVVTVVKDSDDALIATVTSTWHIKRWQAVRTQR